MVWVKSTTEVNLRAGAASAISGAIAVAAKEAASAPLKKPRRESAGRTASCHPGTHMPNLHFGGPLRSARRKIGAADDDRQSAADAGRCRLRRGTDPTRVRGSPPTYCEDAHQREEGPGGSATLEAGGGVGNQLSGRRKRPQLIFSDLTLISEARLRAGGFLRSPPLRLLPRGRWAPGAL